MSYGEALYAVTPLTKSINNKKPNSLNYQAQNYNEKIISEITSMLKSDATNSNRDTKDNLNPMALASSLNKDIAFDDINNIINELDSDDGLDYITTQQVAKEYLKNHSPIRYKQTLTGVEEKTPSKAELIRFKRKAKVVDDPLNVLKSMRSGNVSSDEITTLMTTYPNIYQNMKDNLITELSTKKNIDPKKEKAIRKFLGIPSQRMEAFQTSFDTSTSELNQDSQATPSELNINQTDLLTSGTKQAAGILG
jgi:hypothetical protein